MLIQAKKNFVSDLDNEITECEVRQAIKKLKAGKATGLDEKPGEFLKIAEPIITPFLTKLFNKIFQTGHYPFAWTRSVIVPLLKKGDATNLENYRGISLLSVVSKVFTSILNQRLYEWAEKEEKISEEQAGFRKHYSTVDHIFTLVSMIRSCLFGYQISKLYVAFIDYQKTFDTVYRDVLWKVLQKYMYLPK